MVKKKLKPIFVPPAQRVTKSFPVATMNGMIRDIKFIKSLIKDNLNDSKTTKSMPVAAGIAQAGIETAIRGFTQAERLLKMMLANKFDPKF